MDNLTHGLLGLAIGALRRPDGARQPTAPGAGPRLGGPGRRWSSPTDRAVLLACVVAAELPDIDSFLPASDPVLHALQTHRGISHALVFSPVWAFFATALAWLLYRRARPGPVFLFSWVSVLVAHLAADLWTGWGTRIFLPFSEERWSLDYVTVIDPFFTFPLLVGAFWAFFRRESWRRALLLGLSLSLIYLGIRISSRTILLHRVEQRYAASERVEVFPALLSAFDWRYAAVLPNGYALGRVSLFAEPEESKWQARPTPLPSRASENPTVQEALAWARLPLISVTPAADGALDVRIADLRYNIGGDPTLEFVIIVGPEGETREAWLERGGSVGQVYERWRDDA